VARRAGGWTINVVVKTEDGAASSSEISRTIVVLRSQRVILDRDLAALYGVSTKRLNEAVKRNARRFPADFVFRLTRVEVEILNRSQIATTSSKHRNPRFPPFAFTEHGAIQAANVLNSSRAIEMGVHVVRAFVRLRELLVSNKALAQKLDELERKYRHHDKAIAAMLAAIRELMNPTPVKRRGIGFTAKVD
jgi:DNA-binding HxlR family transcriptional regulator